MPLQDYFRMKNVFGDSNPSSPSYTNPNPKQNFFEDNKSPIKTVQSIEEDDDEISALDQFRESVMNPPERRNPGIMRALGTGLLSGLQGTGEGARKPVYNEKGKQIGTKEKGFWESFGDKAFNVEEAGDILNMPNTNRVEEWKRKTGGLKDAATLETSLAKNAGLEEQRRANAAVIPKREDRLGVEGAAKLDQGQQRIDIQNKVQAVNEWKAKNPQGKVYAPKGGKVVIINPLTGEATDTGIDSGTLSDEDRIKLTGQQRIEQIGKQGENQLGLEDARNTGDLAEIEARGAQSRATKSTTPGKNTSVTADKDLLPSQQKTNLQIKANQYIQEHPEHTEFVKINPNTGMIDITPPSKSWTGAQSGPSKEVYDAIVTHMKGTDKSSTPTEKKTNDKAPINVPPKDKKPVGSVVEDTNSGKPKVIKQYSASRDMTRISTDGGKTFKTVKGRQ